MIIVLCIHRVGFSFVFTCGLKIYATFDCGATQPQGEFSRANNAHILKACSADKWRCKGVNI